MNPRRGDTSGVCAGCGRPLEPSRGRVPRKWCSERCRKRSYGDPCVACGKPTRYGAETARVSEPRCRDCDFARRKIWTREAIVRAIQEWAAVHGEAPAVADWNPWQARRAYHDEARARRFEEESPRWPSFKTVIDEFDGWTAAIIAAGFEPRAPHGGAGNVARRRKQRASVAA